MSSDISYTTEEIAKLLKISKLTVYDLIKKGDLPAYRVGKQMRVDAADLEAYKNRSKAAARIDSPPLAERDFPASPVSPPRQSGPRSLVITGQDVSLDILAKHMEKGIPGIRPLRSFAGSLDSLISMYRGEADIVSTHLFDGDTGEYNLPYIRKLLGGFSCMVINLLGRKAGFYVPKGNPDGLSGWKDLKRPGLRLVNREKGSGARVLLDEQLRLHGIPASQIEGYDSEESNHLGVAGKVASGEADVGVGIEKAAMTVGTVDFVPLTLERYDLVLLKKKETQEWTDAVVRIIRSEAFQNELRSISGYDLSLTGQILYET
ncbi:helix-turn-helix transcriptional regulator [Paenibacillus pinistramenti]|uniref:helix-turn-helix transcriptional regulator n=1 Tax=Paenibacillus pinistramenti TaxID=1768003 RepID=UPI001109BD3C|nr:helix-turn-helix transcriptional regulator [Paenibacillus pinistramenti]